MHEWMFSGFDRSCPIDQAGIFEPDQGIFIVTGLGAFFNGRKNKLFVFSCEMFGYRIPNQCKLGNVGCRSQGGMLFFTNGNYPIPQQPNKLKH
jgi:hypothetical protein